ncbi:Methionine aminopeptidase 1, mitochondrial [Methanimicrococcus sp. At1]|uniref:Methionine aminopeptidase 1, mitochondrial n=1 Tax=Methanimicrococcus hacksteinii TaxID=3028293 RepID=A0ABU3VND5_9EURY|nr:Xaa-Pro peptidase family protein [Methanimicrococcus sp. At1]MDV0444834.1 Methionine aminopeptidase 1, mitochondrial [Methanimicrococcus sp. At1]
MTLLEDISELDITEQPRKKTEPANISEALKNAGADAYLMHGAIHDSDIYYATRFLASDPFSYLRTADGDEILLVSDMEKGRADIESRVPNEKIKTTSDYNYRDLVKAQKDADLAYTLVLKQISGEKNVKTVAVSYEFPAYYYNRLQKEGIDVVLMKSPFEKPRSVKTAEEIGKIAESQKAAEKAMSAAIEMIQKSSPDDLGSGKLVYGGQVLTGKMVLSEIARVLMENNCADDETIVACGPDSADPHAKTYGSLYANHPIVIDIFPQHKYSRYFGDMTRTVIRGEVSEELIRMYDVVKGAQEIGVQTAKPGITCAAVHNAVCDYLEEAGYDTYRSGSKVGFIHTTGHGVGLDIHESPSVSDNPHILEPGNVITIEPGLYYPEIGGIRIEDTIVITEDGCRNLNTLPKIFEI